MSARRGKRDRSYYEVRLRDARNMVAVLLTATAPGRPLSGDVELAGVLERSVACMGWAIERMRAVGR